MGLPHGLDSCSSSGSNAVLRKFVSSSSICAAVCIFSFGGANINYCNLIGCSNTWTAIERRIATLEFDRDRKSMGVIVKSKSGKKTLLVKVCGFI